MNGGVTGSATIHLFFLLYLYFAPLLEKELSNFLPQSPNLPFQFGAEGGALEI